MKNAYFREIRDFLWILTLLLSFMKVSEFYQQLLCGPLIVGMYSLCYLHPTISNTIHGVLPVQSMPLTVFFDNLSKFSLVYLLAWHSPLHTPYISSPNHCLLFATHAHTISVTPFVNCPWNLTHFKNSAVKSHIFPWIRLVPTHGQISPNVLCICL